jgi:hypothetical protein
MFLDTYWRNSESDRNDRNDRKEYRYHSLPKLEVTPDFRNIS